jgi:hypothetical protein
MIFTHGNILKHLKAVHLKYVIFSKFKLTITALNCNYIYVDFF